MVNTWALKQVNGKSMGPYKYPPLNYLYLYGPFGIFIAIQQRFLKGRLPHQDGMKACTVNLNIN